ncbi:unnamed protein product [Timema podura]|uniref:Uncharacterized protein n=1 Tax=Timema podura TaxID=61482 RepID=A0ABN7PLF9_TIMPD|nr:unnamed protein product [Timema podura]
MGWVQAQSGEQRQNCRRCTKTPFVCTRPILVLRQRSRHNVGALHNYFQLLKYSFVMSLPFNIGMGVPLEVPNNFLSWTYNFQFQYSLPENITEFTQYYSRSLRTQKRSLVTDGTSMDRREAGVLVMDQPTEVPVHRGVIYQTLEERLNR